MRRLVLVAAAVAVSVPATAAQAEPPQQSQAERALPGLARAAVNTVGTPAGESIAENVRKAGGDPIEY